MRLDRAPPEQARGREPSPGKELIVHGLDDVAGPAHQREPGIGGRGQDAGIVGVTLGGHDEQLREARRRRHGIDPVRRATVGQQHHHSTPGTG